MTLAYIFRNISNKNVKVAKLRFECYAKMYGYFEEDA